MVSNAKRSLDRQQDGTTAGLFETQWGTHKPDFVQSLMIGLTRRTVLQRGKMRQHMTRAIMGRGTPLDVSFRGFNFRIEGRNNLIEYGILTRPTYNQEEIAFLCDGLGEGDVALDIGCNIGLYSLPMARAVGPNGRVLSIDANADILPHLEFNAVASGLNNVTALHSAVGDKDAMVDLNIRNADVAIVSVHEAETGGTRMRPLVDILDDAGISHVAALKIDIEGHEDKAMVPYLQSTPIDRLPRRIVIEVVGRDRDYPGCTEEFARLGYRLVGRTKNNSMYARD